MALTKLAFGNANTSAGLNALFGIEKGFFADEGIALSNIRIPGGPNVAAALGRGEIELAMFGTPPGLTELGKGGTFKIIGGGMKQKYQMHFAVRKGIEDFAAFKGGTIGLVAAKSCDEWPARELLRREGLDPDKDVTFSVIGYDKPATLKMLENGEIDAVMAYEPLLSMGELSGILTPWVPGYDDRCLPRFQWSLTAAHPTLIERDPDLVHAFLRASIRSARHLVGHPDEWAAFVAKINDVPVNIAHHGVMRSLPVTCADCDLDLEGLEIAIDLQYRLRAIPAPLKINDIVDFSFLPPQGLAAAE